MQICCFLLSKWCQLKKCKIFSWVYNYCEYFCSTPSNALNKNEEYFKDFLIMNNDRALPFFKKDNLNINILANLMIDCGKLKKNTVFKIK